MDSGYQWRIRDWFPKLEDKTYNELRLFHVELLRHSEKHNLVSVKTLIDADLHHFADSMIASSLMRPHFSGKTVYDIGSGGGLPGLVIAILNKDTEVVMVDTDSKRLDFVKSVITKIGLKNAKTLWAKAEDLKENSIEFAVSRGLAALPRALLLMRKAVKPGGTYINMKTSEWPIELASLPPQLCSTWNATFLTDYTLPIGTDKFSLLKCDKIK